MNHATIDIDDPTAEDYRWMKGIIAEFVKETDSFIGHRILDDWDSEKNQFIKVQFTFFVFRNFSIWILDIS